MSLLCVKSDLLVFLTQKEVIAIAQALIQLLI
jgi:hypothetical protein